MSKEEKQIYPGSIDTRVALLEHSIGCINQIFIEIKDDLKGFRLEVKQEINNVRQDNKDIRAEMKDIRSEINSNFRWTLGAFIGLGSLILTGFPGIFAMIAHGFHWF